MQKIVSVIVLLVLGLYSMDGYAEKNNGELLLLDLTNRMGDESAGVPDFFADSGFSNFQDSGNLGKDFSHDGSNDNDSLSGNTELELREGFSPNGDGINDHYVIPWLDRFDRVSMVVFNRWGTIVYEQDKYENNWDGNANAGPRIGKKLPVSTYYYLITIHDTGQKMRGYIFLKR